jgi:hypothetical protein
MLPLKTQSRARNGTTAFTSAAIIPVEVARNHYPTLSEPHSKKRAHRSSLAARRAYRRGPSAIPGGERQSRSLQPGATVAAFPGRFLAARHCMVLSSYSRFPREVSILWRRKAGYAAANARPEFGLQAAQIGSGAVQLSSLSNVKKVMDVCAISAPQLRHFWGGIPHRSFSHLSTSGMLVPWLVTLFLMTRPAYLATNLDY